MNGWEIREPQVKRNTWGKPDDDIPISLLRTRGPSPYIAKPWVISQDLRVAVDDELPVIFQFPFNVEFRAENILTFDENVHADVIFLFSVTKWVHLNGGDEAIKMLFAKIKSLLKLGGFLFLEAEDWKGYKLKKNTTMEIRRNFESIKFRPSQFGDYLVETLGFTRHPSVLAFRPVHGFSQPILVFSL